MTAEFWAGEFGDEYNRRNEVDWTTRVPFLRRVLDETGARSILDVGTNRGWNLRALKSIDDTLEMSGMDVNRSAIEEAQAAGFDVVEGTADQAVQEFGLGVCDLAITSGVLIHIAPEDLVPSMAAIRDVSRRYVLAIEYEADTAQEVEYRGHKGKLWKRPFGRLYADLGLSLVEYTPNVEGYDRCAAWLLERE